MKVGIIFALCSRAPASPASHLLVDSLFSFATVIVIADAVIVIAIAIVDVDLTTENRIGIDAVHRRTGTPAPVFGIPRNKMVDFDGSDILSA